MIASKHLTLRVAALALSTLCGSVAVAQANSIGPDCGTCQGSIYTLTNLGQVADLNTSDGVSDTWRIMLTIDTSGYTGGGVRIDEVAVKISPNVDGAKLIEAPGGADVWVEKSAVINAQGCNKDNDNPGFECADWIVGSQTGAFLPNPGPEPFTWIFEIDVNGGLLDLASLKARYVDATDKKVGDLVSENVTLGDPVTPVPEPASMMLLGTGMLGLVARRRARRRISAK